MTARSVLYYGGIESSERLRTELLQDGVKINSECMQAFTDGTTAAQFDVTLPDGVRGYFVPASKAAQQRQRAAGRCLAPYGWVYIGRSAPAARQLPTTETEAKS